MASDNDSCSHHYFVAFISRVASDSETEDSNDQPLLFRKIVEMAILKGDDTPPPQYFLTHLENGNESGQAAQSFDLREEFGIVIILPSGFTKPGLNIRPYHTTRSPGEEYGNFIPFTPIKETGQNPTDRLLVIELRDRERFLSNWNAAQYERASRTICDLYQRWEDLYVKG